MTATLGSPSGASESLTTVAPVSVSRNSACPCGSGRKYKRCCLAEASAPSVRRDSTTRLAAGSRIGRRLSSRRGSARRLRSSSDRIGRWMTTISRSSRLGFTTIASSRAEARRRSATRSAPSCPLMSARRPHESPPPGSACTACSRSRPAARSCWKTSSAVRGRACAARTSLARLSAGTSCSAE